MSNSLKEENLDNGNSRIVLSIAPPLAPTKAAVLPLVKKDGLAEKAKEKAVRLAASSQAQIII